jgi:arylsulfatase
LRRPVNVLGLLPTLLELAGLPAGGCEAESHADEVRSGRERDDGPVFSEMAFGYQGYRDKDRQVMVRQGRFKLTLFPDGGDPDGALYDLERDPGERLNLFRSRDHQKQIEKMKSSIQAWDRKRGFRA